MEINPPTIGPDLCDGKKWLEVKFNLCEQGSRSGEYVSWTAREDQINYAKDYSPIFWALGTYRLNGMVKKVRTTDHRLLEKMVTERELWIVQYDWAKQFRLRPGKSEYGHTYAFLIPWPIRAKTSPIPRTIKTRKVDGGKIHFTEGVDLKLF